jgi:hypothetical protein
VYTTSAPRVIRVASGEYRGGSNTRLIFKANTPVTLNSLSGSEDTVINCEQKGRGLYMNSTQVTIQGFTIKNCHVNSMGGGLLVSGSTLILDDIIMANNSATKGGALHATNSVVTLKSSVLQFNTAEEGSAVYAIGSNFTIQNTIIPCSPARNSISDIHSINSSSSIDVSSDIGSVALFCQGGSWSASNGEDLCQVSPTRCESSGNEDTLTNDFFDANDVSKCGDNICDTQIENCLVCPNDCSCSFTGARIQIWNCHKSYTTPSCPSSKVSSLIRPKLSGILPFDANKPLTGEITGYFTVKKMSHYTFLLTGQKIGAQLYINERLIVDAVFHQDQLYSSASVILQPDYIHYLKIIFFTRSNGQQSIDLSWKDSLEKAAEFTPFNSSFYNLNVNGDNIFDAAESSESSSFYYPRDNTTCRTLGCRSNNSRVDICGDGVCNDLFAENCFVDCHPLITPVCSPLTMLGTSLGPNTPVTYDTIGELIRNQKYWHLPGVEHMANGFDIITGSEVTAPLFYFSYCDEDQVQVVQDVYRENFYLLPNEIDAKPTPKCSYESQTDSYSNSVSMANSMEQKTGISVTADMNANFFGLVSGSVSFAFSQETSVAKARELETQHKGKLLKTEVSCLTSHVQLKSINFHPNFLQALASVSNTSDLYPIMKKYGTYYYKSASLGGKLTQVTTLSEELLDSKSSSEFSQSTQISFGASVSAPRFSASTSFDGSLDSTVSQEEQSTYESLSARSSVITQGGPPGSFGPDYSSDAPTDFGGWANWIDLLPVPIDYELGAVGGIIPDTWLTKNGTSIKQIWQTAEKEYYRRQSYETYNLKRYKYSLFWSAVTANQNLETRPFRWSIYANESTSILITNQFSGRGRYSPYFSFNFAQTPTTNQVVFHFALDEPLPRSGNISIPSNGVFVPGGPGGHYLVNYRVGGELRLIDWTTGQLRFSKSDPNSPSEEWTTVPTLPHQIEIMYNITTLGSAHHDGEDDYTQAEFTIFGSKDSITWWRNIPAYYWPPSANQSVIRIDNDIPQKDIGEIIGVKIRFGSYQLPSPASRNGILYSISSFTVMTNLCNSGECKAAVFTTAPSVSKTIDIADLTATYFKLYPLNEFATSRAFTSNFVL